LFLAEAILDRKTKGKKTEVCRFLHYIFISSILEKSTLIAVKFQPEAKF